MTNRFSFTPQDWIDLEAEIASIDPILHKLADEFGFDINNRSKDFPLRNIEWEAGGIVHCIGLGLVKVSPKIYNLGMSSYFDEKKKRYILHELLCEEFVWEERVNELEDMIRLGIKMVSRWDESELRKKGKVVLFS